MNSMWRAAALGLVLVATSAQAADDGFLSDYAGLKPAADNPFDQIYISPDAGARASQYTAVMVDQPELFVSPDSKYKGMKPDDMKAVADGLRDAITAELKGAYAVVDAPGPNVLYVRFAVSDLVLEKKKRPILAYIPAGAVVYAAKNLAGDGTSKVNVANMKIEGEVLDSQSLQQLAALTATRKGKDSKENENGASWDEMNGLFSLVGKRLRCRLDNARAPADKQADCAAIAMTAAN